MVKVIRKNLKQHDCGIVAAFNALSWCKKPQPYDKIEFAAMAKYGYSPDAGIVGKDFEGLLQEFGVKPKMRPGITLEEVQSSVFTGKAIVLTYKLLGDPIGHMIMVVLDKHGRVRVINGEARKPGWDNLASELAAGGSEWFFAWELPNREML